MPPRISRAAWRSPARRSRAARRAARSTRWCRCPTDPECLKVANILERIAAYKRQEVAQAMARLPLNALMDEARNAAPVRPFRAALENRIGQGDHALIAEI